MHSSFRIIRCNSIQRSIHLRPTRLQQRPYSVQPPHLVQRTNRSKTYYTEFFCAIAIISTSLLAYDHFKRKSSMEQLTFADENTTPETQIDSDGSSMTQFILDAQVQQQLQAMVAADAASLHDINLPQTTIVDPSCKGPATFARNIIRRHKMQYAYPGISVTVVKNGRVVYSEGFGWSDVENLTGTTHKTVFRVASVSKALTAVGALKMYEQGLLDLDRDVRDYIPGLEFKVDRSHVTKNNTGKSTNSMSSLPSSSQQDELNFVAEQDPATLTPESITTPPKQLLDAQPALTSLSSWDISNLETLPRSVRVTPRDLLSHLSGIRHYRTNAEYTSTAHYNSPQDAIPIFQNDPLEHLPRSKYLYSTFGFVLLSAVMEKASGRPFLEYMDKEVFKPMGMKDTFAEFHEPIVPRRSRHYVRVFDKSESTKGYYKMLSSSHLENAPYVDNSCKWAGGGFLSISRDIAVFGYQSIIGNFLSDETKRMMLTSGKTSDGKLTKYGLGWSLADGGIIRHSGGACGGTSQLIIIPNKKISVAAIVNMQGVSSLNDLCVKIAQCFDDYDTNNVLPFAGEL